MNVAFTTWNGRIAPVFDVAGTVVLIDTDPAAANPRRDIGLPQGAAGEKIDALVRHQVDELVCGAISYPVRLRVEAAGIRLHPFTAGPLDAVIAAWKTGELDRVEYAMPGCCGGRRRRGRCREGNQTGKEAPRCLEEMEQDLKEQAP